MENIRTVMGNPVLRFELLHRYVIGDVCALEFRRGYGRQTWSLETQPLTLILSVYDMEHAHYNSQHIYVTSYAERGSITPFGTEYEAFLKKAWSAFEGKLYGKKIRYSLEYALFQETFKTQIRYVNNGWGLNV